MERLRDEPPNASIILDGAVRVRAAPSDLDERLGCMGYESERTPEGLELSFIPTVEGCGELENESLIGLLQALSAAGVAFARDYKQGWAPADVVSALVDSGVEFSSPTASSFDGHEWSVVKYPWSEA